MIEYGVLNYPGDVTSSDATRPGGLLGVNEVGWPWEVLDAEYSAERDRTEVHVMTARPETVKAAVEEAKRRVAQRR